jgi:hypothetical protein
MVGNGGEDCDSLRVETVGPPEGTLIEVGMLTLVVDPSGRGTERSPPRMKLNNFAADMNPGAFSKLGAVLFCR